MTPAPVLQDAQAQGQDILPQLVIVANAGPAQLQYDAIGKIVPVWKPGGAVAVLVYVVEHQASLSRRWSDVVWYWSATTDAERAMHGEEFEIKGITGRLVRTGAEQYKLFYGTFANSVLWALHHGEVPEVDSALLQQSWEAYRNVNHAFAVQIADQASVGQGATVLINDYHFCLMAKRLKTLRPDLNIVGFWHIAHGEPQEMETHLPNPIAEEIFGAMEVIPWGFHSQQWERNYVRCVERFSPVSGAPKTFVAPAQIDARKIHSQAADPKVEEKLRQLAHITAGRQVIANVGRADPKNGQDRIFRAFELVLDELAGQPALEVPYIERRRSPILVMVMSRTRAGESMYDRSWEQAVLSTDRINERYPRSVILLRNESYDTTLAVQRLADVFVVAAPRGGRDIIGPEAVAAKQPCDPPLAEVITRGAACSETLGEVPVDVVRSFAVGDVEVLGSLAEEGYVAGAYVVEEAGPSTDDELVAIRIAEALGGALRVHPVQRHLRWVALQASVGEEDQNGWLDKVLQHADRHADWPALSVKLRHVTPYPYWSG